MKIDNPVWRVAAGQVWAAATRHKLKTLVSQFSQVLAVISGVVLIVMQAHLLGSAISRFTNAGGWPGTIEMVSHWWMPAVGLLGLALAQVRGEHIEVTILSSHLPHNYAKACMRIVQSISLIVALAITYFSWQSALKAMAINQEAAGVVNIAIWPVAFLLPMSMFVYAATLIRSEKPGDDSAPQSLATKMGEG